MIVKMTILVCDDHPIFRSGVVGCLAADPDLHVVGEASDGEACIAKLEIFKPDILIIDLSMPVMNGFDVLKWVKVNQPDIRVFILSMYAEASYVRKAQALGASGFIAKEDAQSELIAAIRFGVSDFYTSESVGRQSTEIQPDISDIEFADMLHNISGAEMKVLALLTQSMTSRQIAEELCLSVRTVQAHRVSLARKLDVRGPNKLLELAITHGKTIMQN